MLDKKITFVTGKGGVGKSTVSAALAMVAADGGRRVLVCELGTDGHLARVFGVPLGHKPTRVAPGIDAANFVVSDGLVGTLSSFIPFERLVRKVVENRILQMFLETAPSISEAVLLDAVQTSLKDYDRVVVELPASGHALTLLQVPDMIRRMVTRGPVANKATEMEAALLTPQVAELVLVALPEALPVQETIELAEQLRAVTRVPIAAVLLNQTMSPLVQGDEQALLQKLSEGDVLKEHILHMLRAAKRDDHALEQLRTRLGVPVVALPHVMVVEKPADLLQPLLSTLRSVVLS